MSNHHEISLHQNTVAELVEKFAEFEEIVNPLLSNGFNFPKNFIEILSNLVPTTLFSDFLESRSNSYVTAESWRYYLDSESEIKKLEDNELLAQIVILKIFLSRLSNYKKKYDLNLALKKLSSLTGKTMSVTGTWFEIKRRLAGRLFDLGRRGESSETSQFLLNECIEHFSFLIIHDKFAKDLKLRYYRGMRGTSYLFTARFSKNPLNIYEKAAADLDVASELGDNSLQHFHYRIEAYIHSYDLLMEKSRLESGLEELIGKYSKKIEIALSRTDQFEYQSRRILFYKGQYAARKGILEKSENFQNALLEFNSAVENFTNSLNYDDPTIHNNTIFINRGQAYFRLYTTISKYLKEEKVELLTKAIDDLLHKDENGKVAGERGITLPAALFMRANFLEKNGAHNESINEIKLAFHFLEDPYDEDRIELHQRLSKLLWKNEIALGVKENDVQKVAKACENILATSDDVDYPTAHLTQAASFFSFKLIYDESRNWLVRLSEYIEKYVESEKYDGKNLQFEASALGFIYAVLAKNSREQYERGIKSGVDFENFIIEILLKTHKWNTAAIECNPTTSPPQSYIDAGESSLRLARAYQAFESVYEKNRSEKAEGFLKDAYKYYSEIISKINDSTSSFENLARDVPHSKLGEVCYRLYTLTWEPKFADEAISNFETSRKLGNQSTARMGLTGDVYYKRGKFNRDTEDLKIALTYKREARELGARGRENPSVSSAASLLLWELTTDISYLTDAVKFACESMKTDPLWSWSYFQLAEISRLNNNAVRDATEELLSDWSIKDIISHLRLGKTNALYREAINWALKSKEFEKQIFRSRQLVYAIDDPHKLLNKNFIFKHTEKDNAEREIAIVESFGRFLKEHKPPPFFRLPEPIGIFPLDRNESFVYVMRRSTGRRIGELVIDWLSGGASPKETFSKAVQFLAYYHVWGLRWDPSAKPFNKISGYLIKNIVDLWQNANFSTEVCEELKKYLNKIAPSEIALFLKKDAHPENWLLSHSGNIVMIDLEAKIKLPIFFEVVQLIDDYPLFEPNDIGWKSRIEICNTYLHVLKDLGHEYSFNEDEIGDIYSRFLLFRSALNIARFRRSEKRFKDEFSSASLDAIDLREQHFLDVLQFLRKNSQNEEIKDFTTFLLNEIETKRITWSKGN